MFIGITADEHGAFSRFVALLMHSANIILNLKEKKKASDTALMTNLSVQVEAMKQWAVDLAGLDAKGIDEGLLQQLREMGP